jgi:hypothetical protein
MNSGSSNQGIRTSAHSPAAARMARLRDRRRKGLRCLRIVLRESEIDALIRDRRLAGADRCDVRAVRKAIHAFLDDRLR